jgi:gliding motility-associated-like protein
MKHTLKILLTIIITWASSLSVNAQVPIPVCPQTTSFSSMTRGYYFTAPANFTICGIFVEDDQSTAFQAAAIVRFTAGPPPAYAATTNSFVTLFQNLNYVPNNMIPVPNVAINAGDIIGIYGARSAGTINSYGPANCVITIQGIPTTTYRSGMQFSLAAGPGMHDIWNENSGSIGRVTMYTGCCPAPTPIAAVTGPTSVCEGDSATYTVPAQTGATAYNWTVPAGATITGGQNTTSLNVTWNTTPGGQVCVDWTDACATSAPTCLAVTVNPATTTTFNQIAPICSGDPLAPLPTTSTNSINGTWSPAVNNITTTTYSFTPAAGSCASTTTMTITVNQPTVPTFTQVAAICSGDPLAPLPTTSTNGINGTWSPAVNNTTTTTYSFTPATGLCATTTTMIITINSSVSGSTNASICQGDSILIGGVFVSTAGSYTETLTSSVGCDSVLTTNLSINPITSSTLSFTICLGDSVFIESVYYYSDTIVPYTYTSSTGCDSIVNYEVTTSPLPVFSIVGGSAFINLGQSVDLAVMPGVAGTTYFWDPPTGLSCLFCQNPTATPTESMWYFVTVTNANGCSLIDSTFIDVDPSSSIYVPNIFSPNKDGNNDIYLVQGKGIQVFDLSIYNRWGQKVFESDDIEKGWDGTKEGTILNQGVFVYDLKVLFYTGKTFEQTGNITIVR